MLEKNFSFNTNSTAAQPIKQQGSLYINLSIDWDQFDQVASQLIEKLDMTVKTKEIGADLHRWTVDFEGTRLYLTYEETSNSLWFELDRAEDQEILDFIATLLQKQSS
ncbi:DUF3630 family protein [Psychrobium sp. 1_MG-2023]|uniref:DUF3630 family protein n=1 Tax=Psychrobium sp. 1_MG-2023 TaxID=3062624 RepID=UPI000C339816|nr:DUF3630 family protein [Psychrobium sp. 1_MG-2023]MDP2561019.1 DUF3630 family protein [Psychrobium sp. 1_MG-2023]PKF58312.1 DUF3630 domain-containing protein [Alteromonadales bacterium alter-6D02]